MLVLSRRPGESIMVGDEVEVRILEVRGHGDQAVVRLGITAARHLAIHRKEVYDAVVEANREAAEMPRELADGVEGYLPSPRDTEPPHGPCSGTAAC